MIFVKPKIKAQVFDEYPQGIVWVSKELDQEHVAKHNIYSNPNKVILDDSVFARISFYEFVGFTIIDFRKRKESNEKVYTYIVDDSFNEEELIKAVKTGEGMIYESD